MTVTTATLEPAVQAARVSQRRGLLSATVLRDIVVQSITGLYHHIEDKDDLMRLAAEHTANRGDDDALRQQLTHETRAASAERDANRELFLARCAAGKHQVRDVDTCDEQDEANRRRHHEQPGAHRANHLSVH